MGHRTAGDLIFERYLAERGFLVPEHEPDLGIGVRPEYLLEADEDRCLVEVKEFAVSSWPLGSGGVASQEQLLKPIRSQIHEAARKLRRARELKVPLVAVLTDPHRALWGLLRPFELIAAIGGDMEVRIPISATASGAVGPTVVAAGRNGELRNDHPYLTAVVVVHERFDDTHNSETYITHSPGAEALPERFFAAGPADVLYDCARTESGAGVYILREGNRPE